MSEDWKPKAKELLSRHFLLGRLDAELLDQLMGYVRIQRFERGEMLFMKGDPGDSLLGVLAGKVKISALSADGKEIVLNILGPGEIFGEIALLDGKERTADATAMDPTTLVALDRNRFLPFLERQPEVATRLLTILCERLRWVSDLYEDAIFLNLPARLAKRLTRLAEMFGEEGPDGVRIDIKLSQQELGNMTGTTREAVNKVLRGWESEGIVAIERTALTIRRPDELDILIDTL